MEHHSHLQPLMWMPCGYHSKSLSKHAGWLLSPSFFSALPSPKISFFSPHGKKFRSASLPWLHGNKTQGPPAAPQPGWMEIFKRFFKTLHQVIQNKLRVYFGLQQSCRRRLTSPAGCPRQGLTLSIPFCRAGGECFHS